MRVLCISTQNKQAVEEQHKLQTEKGALIETVKRLHREVIKLEAFKKNLLQHLQDEDEVRTAASEGHAIKIGW